MQNLALGYYWVPQKLENVKGGDGDDEMLLGTTNITGDNKTIYIQTGAGKDVLTVGKFSAAGANLEATITDFELGVDKVKVFLRKSANNIDYQAITADNWNQFAVKADQSAINGGTGSKLVIDLDGAGAGTSKYTLYLPTVAYNYDLNTKTIFGL